MCITALLVLVGWAMDIGVMKSITPAWISMKANTAICFLLCSAALIVTSGTGRGFVATFIVSTCLAATFLISSTTLLQYILKANFGIDELLFSDPIAGTATIHPGRTAPAACLSFMILSVALMLTYIHRAMWTAHILVGTAFIITGFALSHYLYNVKSFFAVPRYTQLAFHTIVLSFSGCLGTLMVGSDEGLMKLIFKPGVGGMIMRRVIPLAIIVPSFFGWLRWQGQRANLYDTEFGVALTVLFSTVALFLVIIFAGSLADKVEQEKDAAARLLERTMQRLNLALSTAGVGTWDLSFSPDRFECDEHVSMLLGLPKATVVSDLQEFLSHLPIEDSKRVFSALNAARAEHTSFTPEFRVIWPDGNSRVLSTQSKVFLQDGRERMTGVFWDITERKSIEDQLRFEAYNDPLTRLPNRVAFIQHLDRALAHQRRRGGYEFAVLFLDLDRFKQVNDTFGHSMGDQLLVQVGQRLASLLRPGDIASRFGGDEFTILLDDLNNSSEGGDAVRVASKLHHGLSLPFHVAGQVLYVGSSIGIALSQSGYSDSDTLLRDADVAMYQAKQMGKGRVEVFDKQLYEQMAMTLLLENEMRSAIERNEFFLNYQPIVQIASRQIVGFEALARWKNPHRGLVSPAEFIPVAEESGLIVPLGWYILEEACRANTRLREAGIACPVSVNVSSRQFLQPNFCNKIAEILTTTGVQGRHLKLEITESLTMQNVPRHQAIIETLKQLGIELQIDDFGTGYSSLVYLSQLPIDALKIDQSFVRQLGMTSKGDELCRTVVALAANMNLECIAEGIETEEQLSLLSDMGCKMGQGYLFAKPLSESGAIDFARQSVGVG